MLAVGGQGPRQPGSCFEVALLGLSTFYHVLFTDGMSIECGWDVGTQAVTLFHGAYIKVWMRGGVISSHLSLLAFAFSAHLLLSACAFPAHLLLLVSAMMARVKTTVVPIETDGSADLEITDASFHDDGKETNSAFDQDIGEDAR
jgi:hypothetical protein